MVVKSVRGRRRYVAFTVDKELTRSTLIPKLQALFGENAPYVVQCSEGWAVVRTVPGGIGDAVAMMSKASPGCRSLSTSGTLRTLRQRYPRLQETRPPRKN